MKALVMMLKNLKEGTYHPILYFESPMPGADQPDFVRYKSKGHRTMGFENRDEALAVVKPEICDRLPDCVFSLELENDVLWEGNDIPADVQLRAN